MRVQLECGVIASNNSLQEGVTTLMEATQCCHKEVIKVLLERKANPNIIDKVIILSICCLIVRRKA